MFHRLHRARPLASAAAGIAALAILGSCSSPPAGAVVSAPVAHAATRSATANHGMVVSASSLASEAGRDVLAAGGNAVDAAKIGRAHV